MATVTFMFLVNEKLVWRDKKLHKPWNYGACDARAFYVFAVFKNLKSSSSEDNMPEHALDIFIENATKMVKVISLNAKNEYQTLR